ncbi:hypothetical protein LCGC14_1703810 [marine sediment metagenome]|uniref:Serpin domain-containing protein n=1 Tax=marine sediment metagenome TaxID=412755 RepID=A0A0F9I4R4_9ZZZZ
MNKIAIGLVTVVAGAMWAGQSAKAAERPNESDWRAMAVANNVFALNLYKELSKKDGNLFFSPSSIHTALTMTYAGARGNTERQMQTVLNLHWYVLGSSARDNGGRGRALPGRPWPQKRVHMGYADLLKELKPGKDAGYQLHVANALWGQKGYPWLKTFLDTTGRNYGAGLREMDFKTQTEQARRTINTWVEEKTKDKIKDLLKPGVLTRDTRLVLTNAIYFKGDWASKFKEARTKPAPFHLSAGKTVKVPMMNQVAKFGYAETKDLQVLRMPYKGKELSMLVLLPRKVGDLKAAISWLTKREHARRKVLKGRGPSAAVALAALPERKVIVSMPKFKLTLALSLTKTLQAMGMKDAFSDAADFSGMDGRRDLFISAAVHKAFVDVNEEGTEAAAATAVVIGITSVAPSPPVFRADRPFLFLIRHEKTGAILFLGRNTNPAG